MARAPRPRAAGARPLHRARAARCRRHRDRLRALRQPPVAALGRRRPARRPLGRGLARRHARPRPPDRAPALRLLPRPPRRRRRHRADRHRPRALAAPLARGGDGARDRLLRALDQHVPGDPRARRLPPRLRPARPDGGAAGADRPHRRARARRRAPARRHRARRERPDGAAGRPSARRRCCASWRPPSPPGPDPPIPAAPRRTRATAGRGPRACRRSPGCARASCRGRGPSCRTCPRPAVRAACR